MMGIIFYAFTICFEKAKEEVGLFVYLLLMELRKRKN
jgi:hypothetical protein